MMTETITPRIRGGALTLGIVLLALGLAFGPAWPASKGSAKAKGKTAKAAAQKAAQKAAAQKAAAEEEPFAAGHPLLLLGGLRCQVHQAGVVRHDFTAETGRYDDTAKVMDMDRMQAKFLDQGTTLAAELRCGAGRIWTADRPAEGIATHDMLLQQDVHLKTGDNVMLQSPEMHYSAAETTLRTDKGFVEQIPAQAGYYLGKGQRIEIKLNIDDNSFENLKQYGTASALTELKKSEKAVLNP